NEANNDANVVIDTFLVNSKPIYILFNSEASHSFIATPFVNKHEMKPYSSCQLNVTMPKEEVVPCRTLYIDILVNIARTKLPTNLIQFKLRDFEVILGMDWRSKYKARIECHNQKISLKGPKGNRISYQGMICKRGVKIVSIMTFQLYVRKGYPIYLFHVQDMDLEEEKGIRKFHVVNEFEDVFQEELPRMPLVREMDFKIYLIPRTGANSKAPYRMAPVEMKELKVQLEELLDKGYIIPSVSPWENQCFSLGRRMEH
ncbi:Dynein heavy chain 9 axonemal, partial [Bienertia sinuspersici]